MTKKMTDIVDRGFPVMTVAEVAVHILGVSPDTFTNNYRYTPLFMREVPDIGIKKSQFRRSDAERYFKLNKR
ncbi:hypothetical protein ESZ50_07890 [Weissella muntiaci]|uniref:DNA-binding protein n=1 Tax=Weissella muntiaci TaxID=2508881 RepID=A0A6C2C566_9LACO|nr:hypothetical protein [Weissella muntiaci]TYC48789.1 hypothetical protein ESZ50_07890 [Weissella muntiaci]